MSRISQLETLLAADPDDADVRYMLAQEEAKADEHERAVQRYDECLALNQAYLYAYFHKARSLEALDQIVEAKDALTQGLALARAARDAKAESELASYLDQLE